MPRFEPGQSGNPSGRPAGSGFAAKLRTAIEGDVSEIIEAVVDAAKGGDLTAAKLLLDRVFPALKPVDCPVTIPRGHSLSDCGTSVLDNALGGMLTPDQADRLMSAISKQARVVEVDELVRRVEALESGT
jgi:hypothetical protein